MMRILKQISYVTIGAMSLLAGCGGSNTAPTLPDVNQVNLAPVFSTPSTLSVPEGITDTIVTVSATDADNDSLIYTISGGADSESFTITSTGALSFVNVLDFNPASDSDEDNVFLVVVDVSDGTATASLNLSITVTEDGIFTVNRIVDSGLFGGPLFALGRGDGSNQIFIVEKEGVIQLLDLDSGDLQNPPFLNIGSTISTQAESGLLGMSLAPDFATSGIFYVHATNVNGDTEIRRYTVSTDNSNIADINSEDVILTFSRPSSLHHGGWLDFGPDGYLYILLGDGDVDANAAQDNSNFLGTLLRIDPSSDDFPNDDTRDYAIPSDNPFVGATGLGEIFAYGMRNPYQGSFDRVTGNLYIGDVGENNIEEVDLIELGQAGQNFGWPILEGTRVNASGSTDGLVPPILEYSHGTGPRQGDAIVGGYVYRGPVTSLQGRYIFGDFVNNNFWSVDADDIVSGQTITSDAFTIETDAFAPDAGDFNLFVSFAEDDNQNLYLIDLDGEVFVITP